MTELRRPGPDLSPRELGDDVPRLIDVDVVALDVRFRAGHERLRQHGNVGGDDSRPEHPQSFEGVDPQRFPRAADRRPAVRAAREGLDHHRKRDVDLPQVRLLGYDDPGLHHSELRLILAPGELLLFFTDGLLEARAADGKTMFGHERLTALGIAGVVNLAMLTTAGRKQLGTKAALWTRYAEAVFKVLQTAEVRD